MPNQAKEILKVGSAVWIRSGLGPRLEPGIILALNVHQDVNIDSEKKSNANSATTRTTRERKKEKNTGVLVKMNITSYETIVHEDDIEIMFPAGTENGEENKGTANGLRRSRRKIVANIQETPLKSKHGTRKKEGEPKDNIRTPDLIPSSSKTSISNESDAEKSIDDEPIGNLIKNKPSKKRKINASSTHAKKKIKVKSNIDLGKTKSVDTESNFVATNNRKSSTTKKETKTKTSNKMTKTSRKKKMKEIKKQDENETKQDDQEHEAENENILSVNDGEGNQDETHGVGGEPDGHGGLDQPSNYSIGYSPTGRAVCRRCDEKILKQQLRVSHRPLFRGKPGFMVHRHLQCIVFDAEITDYKQVDGHHKLKPNDLKLLRERVMESAVERKKEMEELRPDELVQEKFKGEIRPNPSGLCANLLPFQIEGFSWMVAQEKKDQGGILADEMGMGKTLQTICTILDNRPKLQHALPGAKFPPDADLDTLQKEEVLWENAERDWKHEMNMQNVPQKIRPNKGKHADRAGTLVVCPMIALHQWKSEIQKFTQENGSALTVVIYHGPDRSKLVPKIKMKMYDVVLTTYQVLEQDMRKMVSPNKVKCPNCGKKFKVDKLRIHLKYFCGIGSQRTEAQARQRRGRRRGNANANVRRTVNASRRNMNTKKRKISHTGGDEDEDEDVSIKEKKKKTFTKSNSKKTASLKRKTRRSPSRFGSSSESEDTPSKNSVLSQNKVPKGLAARKKPARKAASQASRRMTSMIDSDGSDFQVEDEDYESPDDEESEDTDLSDDLELGPKENTQKRGNKKCEPIDTDESESSSDEEDEAEKMAIEKQRQALEIASKGRYVTKPERNKKGANKKVVLKKNNKPKFMKTEDDDLGVDMDALLLEAMAGSQMSVLHSLSWWRVVLDEAHMIKSRSSQTTQAAFALTAIYRWCLSGTPLQNRVGEFYSLIRFLRIDPMAHYFCRSKDCNCKSLHYRMVNGRCQDCGHGSVNHYSHFNRYVLNPIQRDGYSGDGRRAMFILKNEVLDKCLIRRTKESRAEDMNLPPRIVNIRTVRLHPVEEDFYNALYTQTRSSFSDYVADGTLLNNYAHIFDLLMRMRQSVDHPYLIVYYAKAMEENSNTSLNYAAVTHGTTNCQICHEPCIDQILSSCCSSGFCKSCVVDYMSASVGIGEPTESSGAERNAPCPSCGAPFSIDLNQPLVNANTSMTENKKSGVSEASCMPSLKSLSNVATGSILRRIDLSKFATSSKIEALTEELVRMRQTSPGSKAIVFSQFVNMLDLIRWRLHSDPCLRNVGLGARALHGAMDIKSRDVSLKDFREDNNVRVLLMSLKAGGVALNLTVANHIYLMDPWWNPAAEMQAIDRTHRLGQYRPIRAIRFIAENTVEERILQLQEKKRLVFDGTVGRDAGSLKMLTIDDMKSLFS